MTNSPLDQKFLFAILALQMSFINKDELLLAMSHWLEDKSRGIDAHLIEDGAITEADRSLLLNLVDRYVDNHGGDTEKSLATVTLSAEVQSDLKALGDSEVDATIQLASKDPGTEIGVKTVAMESGERPLPNRELGNDEPRYRVLKPHAKGGLGRVFVAQDLELNREVALKEIRDDFADDPSNRERFVLEAEVTGGLEHPGVVPVYGLGRYPSGRPYYAMRFVKGDSLRDAVTQLHENNDLEKREASYSTLEFRKLLGRFIDVCYAIAYAHSRGVLHRDIKPGNIMLGNFGETLVVDWGLAKIQGIDERVVPSDENTLRPSSGSSVNATRMGIAIGTPAFMSPEQAEGRIDQLGPASDVYSLGATLYFMLTSQSPVDGKTLEEALEIVKKGDVPPPRERVQSIPKSLEAICQKAMAHSPQDRYRSAEALADDIESYLADEPVAAFQEPVAIRTRRWIRKHPAMTASTAAAVLVSTIGLAVFSSIVSGKNTKLNSMNVTLDQNVQELRRANDRASQAVSEAEKNERVAREQSQLALSTLTTVVGDIQNGMKYISGAGETRRKLLATSLEQLDEVATQYLDQATYDVSTVNALNEMGDVVIRFGVGDSNLESATLQRNEEDAPLELANKFYQRALELIEKLVQDEPDHPDAARLLADTKLRICNVALFKDEFDDAEVQYSQVIEDYRNILRTEPDNKDVQVALAIALNKLGIVNVSKGTLTESMTYIEQSLEIRETLAETYPKDGNLFRQLCISYSTLADLQTKTGKTSEALANFEYSVDLFRKLVEQAPNNSLFKRDLAVTTGQLGDAQLSTGQTALAIESLSASLDLTTELRDAEPADPLAQVDLARSLRRLAIARLHQGRVDESIRLTNESIKIGQLAIDRNPDDGDARWAISTAYRHLGDSQMRLGETLNAIESFEKGLAVEEESYALQPRNPVAKRFVAGTLDMLGNAYLQAERVVDAKETLQRAIKIREELVSVDENDSSAKRDLAGSYLRLGDILLHNEERDVAATSLKQGLEILEMLAEQDNNDKRVQADISVALERLGTIEMEKRRISSALSYFERKRDMDEKLVALDPNDIGFQSNHAISLNRLGSIYVATYRTAEGIEAFRKSLDIMLKLVAIDPTALKRKRDLTTCYGQLGDALIATGELEEGLDSYTKAAEILAELVPRIPNDVGTLANLAVCYERMGDLYTKLGEQDAAINAYKDAASASKAVVKAGTTNSFHHYMVFAGEYRLAVSYGNAGKYAEAKETLENALETLKRLKAEGHLPASEERWIEVIPEMISESELRVLAVGEWSDIDALELERRQLAIYYRIAFFAGQGDVEACKEALDRWIDLQPTNSDDLYNLACAHGLVVAAIGEIDEPDDERQDGQQELATNGIEVLARAIKAGYTDYEHMKTDPDLDSLRDEPGFDQLLEPKTDSESADDSEESEKDKACAEFACT